MLLGDVIARLQEPEIAAEALLALDVMALATGTRNAAAEEGMTVGDFIAAAVRRFVDRADDETWLKLMEQMACSVNPGAMVLRRTLCETLPS